MKKRYKKRTSNLCELLKGQVVFVVIVGSERFISRLEQYHPVCADDGHDKFYYAAVTIVGTVIKRMETLDGTLGKELVPIARLFEA